MGKATIHDGYEKIVTTLGKETVFNGVMNFKESLKIDGKFDGKIDSVGFLYIEDGAEVVADIKARSIVVGGVVKGNIVATDSLEMLDSGKVFGNVRTSRLRIADGVVFEGKCEMIKDPNLVDIFSADGDKIKKTVERL